VITDLTPHFPITRDWPRQTSAPADITDNAIHHTATLYLSPTATTADELNQIAVIHEYHIRRGFGGFGYHGIAFPSGRPYLVVPFDQWGANVADENNHIHGYAAAGTYTTVPPPLALQTALAHLIAAGRRYLKRTVPDKPHRHWGGTTCPGEQWRAWVPTLTNIATFITNQEDDMGMTPEQETRLRAVEAQAHSHAATAPPPPPPSPPPAGRTYTVRASDGADGLSGIAMRQLGNAARWPEIASLNGIPKPYVIHTGQVLRLP